MPCKGPDKRSPIHIPDLDNPLSGGADDISSIWGKFDIKEDGTILMVKNRVLDSKSSILDIGILNRGSSHVCLREVNASKVSFIEVGII